MATKKYVNDFRLDNRISAKTGKIETVAVYQGKWYAFERSRAEMTRTKVLYTCLTALAVTLFLLVLLINAPSGHVMYVTLPFAFMVFPLFFMAASCLRLWQAKEKFTREHNDKMRGRFISCTIAAMALSGVSLIGHIVYLFLAGVQTLDLIALGSTALILISALTLFLQKDELRTYVLDEAETKATETP